MKIFTSTQIHELDKYTIAHEPISSVDLMERAAKALTVAVMAEWSTATPIILFAGPGNNGGDALAMARMRLEQGYNVTAYLFNISGHLSEDCAANKARLIEKRAKALIEVKEEFEPPRLEENTLVIDGLFGSGLNKPLAGGFASLAKYINASPSKVVSIDIPSGLMTDDNTYNIRANIVRADLTLTLQQKKLSFLFPENQQYIGRLKVLDIRLSQEGMEKIEANYTLIEENDIRPLLLKRNPYAHKGNMGNALIIAGSYGMGGASVLATKACLRAGAGKVTAHTPKQNNVIMQVSVPEAIIQLDRDETTFSEAVETEGPVVIDADAINILANHRTWLQQIPQGAILTPHPKELERLEGHSTDSYEQLTKARTLAERLQAFVILKGHHSALCLPDGHVIFNSTGNAGMATAGSGDVLTGIITGLLARGYKQQEACLIGMYLHGLAGDIAARELGEESLIASDLIQYLPQAFKKLRD